MLGGMGELHLEVLVQRLQSEWKLPIRAGKMRVAYRESVDEVRIKSTLAVALFPELGCRVI
eukprot:scaffold50030_cov27-Tisochrysis_lutea.AAC.2